MLCYVSSIRFINYSSEHDSSMQSISVSLEMPRLWYRKLESSQLSTTDWFSFKSQRHFWKGHRYGAALSHIEARFKQEGVWCLFGRWCSFAMSLCSQPRNVSALVIGCALIETRYNGRALSQRNTRTKTSRSSLWALYRCLTPYSYCKMSNFHGLNSITLNPGKRALFKRFFWEVLGFSSFMLH